MTPRDTYTVGVVQPQFADILQAYAKEFKASKAVLAKLDESVSVVLYTPAVCSVVL